MSLEYWRRRIDAMAFINDENLYVTQQEYGAIRRLEQEAEWERARRGALGRPQMMGFLPRISVVVDAEQRDAQIARMNEAGALIEGLEEETT